jgi:hypothetical protein
LKPPRSCQVAAVETGRYHVTCCSRNCTRSASVARALTVTVTHDVTVARGLLSGTRCHNGTESPRYCFVLDALLLLVLNVMVNRGCGFQEQAQGTWSRHSALMTQGCQMTWFSRRKLGHSHRSRGARPCPHDLKRREREFGAAQFVTHPLARCIGVRLAHTHSHAASVCVLHTPTCTLHCRC